LTNTGVPSYSDLEKLCDWYEDHSEYTASKNSKQIVEGIKMNKEPLNQILFGPPGTGKTFATTELAVKIADPIWYEKNKGSNDLIKKHYDSLVDDNQIVFTTFHQSFSYEDFIEGIRAETDDETGQIRYPIEDGVFKILCESAVVQVTANEDETINIAGRKIWKMSLGNTLFSSDENVYQECLESNYVLLGYGDDINFEHCHSRKEIKVKLESETGKSVADNSYALTSVNLLKNVIKTGDLIVVSDGNRKFRAIGMVNGEYGFLDTEEGSGYHQMRPVKWLRQYEPSLTIDKLFKKGLSQMSLYELKSSTIDLDKLSALLESPKNASDKPKSHVMIIDEINRGNISRIFGELITLLEPTKRKGMSDERVVTLPYSKKKFSIPSNIYVIGTMNTADKSLAQLDLALRRRFRFVETPPSYEQLNGIVVHDVDIGEMLSLINQRIEVLLDKDHLIGHSYFLELADSSDSKNPEHKLAQIFKHSLIPLLQEYFFNSWERIGWVLNDPSKTNDAKFIVKGGDLSLDNLFSEDAIEQISDRRYQVNENSFDKPESYQGIMTNR
jgi:5-methylcytosine-specific restriction protein B